MGCTISPILFVMAMLVIHDAACCYASGPRLNDEEALPAMMAFVDDATILTPDVSYTEDMLG